MCGLGRQVYLDWRGEAGQDPTESGGDYKKRMHEEVVGGEVTGAARGGGARRGRQQQVLTVSSPLPRWSVGAWFIS
jgi:hypothetical protein|eukprot:COSAG01_NODE_214_length_21729_cov_684.831623_8_plen_76_part_00